METTYIELTVSFLEEIFLLPFSKNTKLVLLSPIQFNKDQEIQMPSCTLGTRLLNNYLFIYKD